MDDRLKEKALFQDSGISYLQAPIFERPLQVIPPPQREQFTATLNELIRESGNLSEFFSSHPHYDGEFRV